MKYERYWIGFGDTHGDAANAARIPELPGADGAILCGDLTTRGGAAGMGAVIDAVARINPAVMALPGNMDTDEGMSELVRRGVSVHRRVVELAPGVGLVGLGLSSPTPFGTPGEVPDAVLDRWLEELAPKAREYPSLVLAAHDPPHGTAADILPRGSHVGSRAVRAFIEEFRPAVCLCGHIHEARAVDSLGPTTIVNPGMLPMGGYAVIGLSGGRLYAELKTI